LSATRRLKTQLEINIKDGEKVKVSPLGDVLGLDGRVFKIDGELLLKSINETNLHIPLDINHNFSEAVGWFDKTSFEIKDDGLYANLELNNKGRELIANKSYRYLSPVFITKDNKVVIGLDSVGLVNRPNLLNKELNTKSKKENNLEELEKLKKENEALKKELQEYKSLTQKAKTDVNFALCEQSLRKQEDINSLKDEIEAIKTALKHMNKKISLNAKTNLEESIKSVDLSKNDKKIADLLDISYEEFLKNKEQN